MIDLTRVIEVLGLASLQFCRLLIATRQGSDYAYEEFVLHAEQNHALHLVEEFRHISATSTAALLIEGNEWHQLYEELVKVEVELYPPALHVLGELFEFGVLEAHVSDLEVVLSLQILYFFVAQVLVDVAIHLSE
jgi:hypothetical protein